MKKLALAALLCAGAALAQIPQPQLNLSGNIGCQGFACLNNGTIPMTDASRNMTALETSAVGGFVVTGTWTADRTLTVPAGRFGFLSAGNGTTGGHNLILCSASGGSCLTIPSGQQATGVWFNGTNMTGTLPSSGGSPGGTNGAIQYNNSGSFGGAVLTGLLKGNGTSPPTAATAGTDYLAPNGSSAALSQATLSAFGVVKPDGSTITISGGVISSTGGGGSSPCGLPSTGNNICITAAPYNASGAGATTTTTSGTFGVGTSGTVASCSTFNAGNGVLITGAGAAGANYIGTVASCSGTTLTLTSATSTSVTTGTVVQHDETAAFQSAITALASTGGQIYIPNGTGANIYLVNGPLQDTGGANAILVMPHINYQGAPPVNIKITGGSYPTGTGGYDPNASTIQTSSSGGGCILGGYFSGSTIPNFTNVLLDLENLQITTYGNPNISDVCAQQIAGLRLRHMSANVGPINPPTPTHAGQIAFSSPQILNNVANQLDDVISVGNYTGFQITEHEQIGSAYAVQGHTGFLFDNGSNSASPGTYDGNAASADYLWSFLNAVGYAGGANKTFINVQMADSELNTADLIDSGNHLLGTMALNNPYSPFTLSVTGASNLELDNINLGTKNFGQNALHIQTSGNLALQAECLGQIFGCQLNVNNNTSDLWALGDVLGSGYAGNGTEGKICEQHVSGTLGGNVYIFCDSVTQRTFNPAITLGWAAATPEGASGAMDTGLSRLAAHSLALGNGTNGDTSGSLTLASLSVTSGNTTDTQLAIANTTSGASWRYRVLGSASGSQATGACIQNSGFSTAAVCLFNNTAMDLDSGEILGFTSGSNLTTFADSAISRCGVNCIAVGNGTAADTTGALKLNNVYVGTLTSGNPVCATTGGQLTTTPCVGTNKVTLPFGTGVQASLAAGACYSSGVSTIAGYGAGNAWTLNFVGIATSIASTTGLTLLANYRTDTTAPTVTVCNPTSSTWTNPGGLSLVLGAY